MSSSIFNSIFITDDTVFDIKMYTPFVYVDVSDTVILTLFIQPLPERFNTSDFRVWLIKNDTGKAFDTILNGKKGEHIQHPFSVEEGVYYFKVTALHPACNEYGCWNSTSPLISISNILYNFLFNKKSTITCQFRNMLISKIFFINFFCISPFRTSFTSSSDNDH